MEEPSGRPWTFFTHHGHVLIILARDPTLRLRDIAQAVGVTERATATIVTELVQAGYLQRFKDGRRNRYQVILSGELRHPAVAGVSVAEVLAPMLPRDVPIDLDLVPAAADDDADDDDQAAVSETLAGAGRQR